MAFHLLRTGLQAHFYAHVTIPSLSRAQDPIRVRVGVRGGVRVRVKAQVLSSAIGE